MTDPLTPEAVQQIRETYHHLAGSTPDNIRRLCDTIDSLRATPVADERELLERLSADVAYAHDIGASAAIVDLPTADDLLAALRRRAGKAQQ